MQNAYKLITQSYKQENGNSGKIRYLNKGNKLPFK